MFRGVISLVVVSGLVLLNGCGSTGGGNSGGVLNQLDSLPNTDGDVFAEITPPTGVDLDLDTSIALSITNTITRSQAEAASGSQIPAAVSGSIALNAKVSVNLTYPGDVTQRLPGTFPVGPFDLAFEIACPELIEVTVSIIATAPLIGDTPVTSFGPYVFTQDGTDGQSFQCGTTVSIATFVDDATGDIGVSVDVQ